MSFSSDLKEGEATEFLFLNYLLSKGRHKGVKKMIGNFKAYDLIANDGTTYEVKFDRYARDKKSPNLAIEYECSDKPSGIATTTADYWVQYDGTYFYILKTKEFKEWLNDNYRYLIKVPSGENAQSILVKSENLASCWFCEMVELTN